MPRGEQQNSEISCLIHSSGNETEDARVGKDDSARGESFKSWKNYAIALAQTPGRFKDRLLSRSDEISEVQEITKRSENDMKRTLNWWDLTWFGFGAVMGTGIFVLTGQEAHDDAGPAIVVSYALSGLSVMLSVFCYTEFAVEIPVAGGTFAYLRVELGDVVAFIAAGNIMVSSIIGGAAVARSWTSYFATLLNHNPDDFRIHTNLLPGFNLLDPIAVVVKILTGLLALRSTRATSFLNWVSSAVNTVVIFFIIVAGFANAKTSNLTPFLPYGAKGVFRAAAIVYFAYGGFDAIATVAEEAKNPSKDIPVGLLGSMSAITVIYCLMALALCCMQNYRDIDVNAAYSVAFQRVGWNWAKYLVALGALKGITTVMLVGAVGRARYVTHIGRTHMIPPWFALVNEETGTPVNATAATTIASALLALFTSLHVLSNLFSLTSLFVLMLMSLALLVRRYHVRGRTSTKHFRLLICFGVVIISSSIGSSTLWGLDIDGWTGYAIAITLWLLATGGLAVFVPQSRKPKVWGVPLVPWLPSLSIFINIFLMGSLNHQAFISFGICTTVIMLYYIFFALHASYDMVHSQDIVSTIEENTLFTKLTSKDGN